MDSCRLPQVYSDNEQNSVCNAIKSSKTEDNTWLFVAEALFPLVSVGALKCVRMCGNPLCAFHFAAEHGTKNIASWMSNNQTLNASLTVENILTLPNTHGKTELQKEGFVSALSLACKHSHLDFAKWLSSRYSLHERLNFTVITTDGEHLNSEMAVTLQVIGNAMETACLNGDIDTAQWLSNSFLHSVPNTVPQNFTLYDALFHCFFAVCKSGNLVLAKWFVDRFSNLEYYSNLEASNFAAAHSLIVAACRSGSIELVEFLRHIFHIAMASLYQPSCLRAACECGQLNIITWFAQIGISPELVNTLIKAACMHNHFHVAIWFVERYKVPGSSLWHMIPDLCNAGNLETIKAIDSKWPIPIHEMELDFFDGSPLPLVLRAIQIARQNNDRQLLDWLHFRFGILPRRPRKIS